MKLTCPENYETKCTIPKASAGPANIICLFKYYISSYVAIEQQILNDGLYETLIIYSIISNICIVWDQEKPYNNDIDWLSEELSEEISNITKNVTENTTEESANDSIDEFEQNYTEESA